MLATPPPTTHGPAEGRALLAAARDAIARSLTLPAVPWEDAPWLAERGATFVTLRALGDLRGCVGSLEAWRPLGEDVRANALAAAFRDSRFPPLTAAEWAGVRVEVSLLSSPEALSFGSEDDLLAQVEIGRHGVILEHSGRRGTFLPQVWADLPEPRVFLTQLKRKAGLRSDFWADDVQAWRYEVEKWTEDS